MAFTAHACRIMPVQIAAMTETYGWKDDGKSRLTGKKCGGLRTLCAGTEEAVSPIEVFFQARKLFKEEGIGVVFVPSYSPARYLALSLAAKSLGLRTVMMNESHAGTEKAAGWKKWIKRQIVKQFDAALVGGAPHKRHFGALGIPEEKIFTGYDAVDNDFFAARADEIRAEAKKNVQCAVFSAQEEGAGALSALNSQRSTEQNPRCAYGLPDRYFLSLGRMVEKKNLATLVSAYAKFCDEWRVAGDEREGKAPLALVFVGSGELEPQLEAQARSLGLEVVDRRAAGASESGHSLPAPRHKENCGAVFFYGFRQLDENPVFYALAEAFVLPSLYEEWGLVVNEAMACSLPVIVSRTAGCAEDLVPGSGQVTGAGWRVAHGEATGGGDAAATKGADARAARPYPEERSNGFIFDPASVEELSESLRRIAEMGDGRGEMGRKSREIVAYFSCENFARQALAAAEAAMEDSSRKC